jgi:hypothetical protein
MSQTTTELKSEFKKSIDLMCTLGDEIRVKLHLAGMDARDQWNELEPRLAEIERAADKFSAATEVAVRDAIASLTKIRDTLVK